MEIYSKLEPDPKQISQMLKKDISGVIQSGLLRVAGAIEAEAVMLVPVRTGNLRNSIRKYMIGKDTAVITATAPYAKFVHEGTGLYGHYKKAFEIRPKEKKALAFTWLGRKIVVKKATVKGQRPQRFFSLATEKVRPRFREIFFADFNK